MALMAEPCATARRRSAAAAMVSIPFAIAAGPHDAHGDLFFGGMFARLRGRGDLPGRFWDSRRLPAISPPSSSRHRHCAGADCRHACVGEPAADELGRCLAGSAPLGLNPVAKTMYYRGWPACPFMVSPRRGTTCNSDHFEWTPLALNGILFVGALWIARVVCQRRLAGGLMRIGRLLRIILVTLLLIYIASYARLSSGGCYEPAAIGLNGVKSYGWRPRFR